MVGISRVNFYRTLLGTYLNLGLIPKQPAMDNSTRKVVPHNFAVAQPVSGRETAKPSVMNWAYWLGRKWNALFSDKAPA